METERDLNVNIVDTCHGWLANPLARHELRRRCNTLAAKPPGIERAKLAHRLMDREIANDKIRHSEYWGKIQCRASCSKCCHQRVELTADEAELIAELSRGRQLDRKKVADQAACGNDSDAHYLLGDSESACVFLEGDDCGIYENRPLACRGYHVLTPPEFCGPREGQTREGAMNAKEVGISVNPNIDMWLFAAHMVNLKEGRMATDSIAQAIAGAKEE